MGIDIYARWTDITAEEEAAQMTGYMCPTFGHLGYLREAYHGEPYATRVLVPDAFEEGAFKTPIPAALLRQRLPSVLLLAEQRERALYQSEPEDIAEVLQSYREFVALCERHEARTGKPCRIIASW